METLRENYINILQEMNARSFNLEEDKYSGVFLPVPFDQYWDSPVKIMLIGRETSGWNTQNNKNTISRVMGLLPGVSTELAVEEAIARYQQHLVGKDRAKLSLKSRSRFKQYFFRLAQQLNLAPQAIVYGNLLAWDYDRKTPLTRPHDELQQIITTSLKLLATQISYLKPDFIIFASGATRTDSIIKRLLTEHLGGYETSSVIPKKRWEFKAANAICFRIAHPRAMGEHKKHRDFVIERIKELTNDNLN